MPGKRPLWAEPREGQSETPPLARPWRPPGTRLQGALGGRGAPPLPARATILGNQLILQLPSQPRIRSLHAPPPARPPPLRLLRLRRRRLLSLLPALT